MVELILIAVSAVVGVLAIVYTLLIQQRGSQEVIHLTQDEAQTWKNLSQYEREQIEAIADTPEEVKQEIDDWS